MTKKIVVDQNKCIGCNTCPLMSPNVFELDTNTCKAFVKKQPEIITKEIEETVSCCPVAAISIVEE